MACQVSQRPHLAEANEIGTLMFEPADVAASAEDVVDYLLQLAERHPVFLDIRRASQTPVVQADRGAL